MDDVVALLDSRSADDVMSTLALAADTAAHHQHQMTFDPNEADQKHSTLSFALPPPLIGVDRCVGGIMFLACPSVCLYLCVCVHPCSTISYEPTDEISPNFG